MTQEQKTKLEQLAKAYYDCWPGNVFLAGAQTILDNPGEWGLEHSTKSFKDLMAESSQLAIGNELLQSKLTKYREALEMILGEARLDRTYIDSFETMVDIAKEALKQQDNE